MVVRCKDDRCRPRSLNQIAGAACRPHRQTGIPGLVRLPRLPTPFASQGPLSVRQGGEVHPERSVVAQARQYREGQRQLGGRQGTLGAGGLQGG